MALILAFKTYAHPRGWEYEVIANRLLAGEGYSFPYNHTTYWSFNTPLFGYLCAGVYAITDHSYFAILIIQSLFSVALALTTFKIAKLVFSERVGLLAAGMVAFHPGFIYYDVFNLLPLSIDSFLIAAITLALLRYKDLPTVKGMAIIGGLIGIATLSRGITGALLPFVVIYLVLFARSLNLKKRIMMAVCVVCTTFIILAPWLIRNYVIQRQFFLISSSAGENLWRGNNIHATGTTFNEHKVAIWNLWPQEFKEKVYARTEMQQMEFFKTEAINFIRAHPLAAATLYIKKVYYFWWFSPQSGTIYPQRYLAVYKYFHTILLSFLVAGVGFALASSKRQRLGSYLILLAIPLTICLAQSVFYVEGRHRWLIEPLMMIFSAYGALRLWEVLKQKLSSPAVLNPN